MASCCHQGAPQSGREIDAWATTPCLLGKLHGEHGEGSRGLGGIMDGNVWGISPQAGAHPPSQSGHTVGRTLPGVKGLPAEPLPSVSTPAPPQSKSKPEPGRGVSSHQDFWVAQCLLDVKADALRGLLP